MKLVGFNFTKIHAEKPSSKAKGNLNVKTNIDISDIKEVNSDFVEKTQKLIAVTFEYTIKYEPDFAEISFKGNSLFSLDQNGLNEVLTQWKDKKIPEQFKTSLFNVILKKSSLRALQLEEELSLPSHFPMPSIKSENNSQSNSTQNQQNQK